MRAACLNALFSTCAPRTWGTHKWAYLLLMWIRVPIIRTTSRRSMYQRRGVFCVGLGLMPSPWRGSEPTAAPAHSCAGAREHTARTTSHAPQHLHVKCKFSSWRCSCWHRSFSTGHRVPDQCCDQSHTSSAMQVQRAT